MSNLDFTGFEKIDEKIDNNKKSKSIDKKSNGIKKSKKGGSWGKDREYNCDNNSRRSIIVFSIIASIFIATFISSISIISLAIDCTVKINFDIDELDFTPDDPILFSTNTSLYASSDNATFNYKNVGFIVMPSYVSTFYDEQFFIQFIKSQFFDEAALNFFTTSAGINPELSLLNIITYKNSSFSFKLPSDFMIAFYIDVEIVFNNESLRDLVDSYTGQSNNYNHTIRFFDLPRIDYVGRNLIHGTMEYNVQNITYGISEDIFNYWNLDRTDEETYDGIDFNMPYLLNIEFKQKFWLFALGDTFGSAGQI